MRLNLNRITLYEAIASVTEDSDEFSAQELVDTLDRASNTSSAYKVEHAMADLGVLSSQGLIKQEDVDGPYTILDRERLDPAKVRIKCHADGSDNAEALNYPTLNVW